MKKQIDYINLIDVAKMNLNECINKAIKDYKTNIKQENKIKIIELIQDRKKIFLFNKETIKKYL